MTEPARNRFQKFIDGLKNTDSEVKFMSVAALGILRIKEHSNALCDLLSSPDTILVEAVIKSLGQIGNPSSAKYLVDFVTNRDDKLAKAAVESLNKIDLSSCLDILIKACGADQPAPIRYKFVKLLSDYNDIRVASLMNEILGQTRDPELLTAAVSYFIKYPSPERHTPLKMLTSNGNWNISLVANLALSRLRDEGALAQVKRLAKSSNPDVRQIIIDALISNPLIQDRPIFQILFEDNRVDIRKKAIEGLTLFSADERINIIRHWLEKENDNNIRIALTECAAKEKSPILYSEIFKLLQSTDEKLQKTAIDALSKIGEPIVDNIITDYERMPLLVKEHLLLVLGRIGSPKGVNIIKDAIAAKERWLRINGIEAACMLKSPELVQLLKDIVKNPTTDIWVMATTISVLGRLNDPSMVEYLIPNLKNEDARVRANTIEALSGYKWEGLPEACFGLLKDRNDRVRVNAAIALWRSGHSEVFGELEKMSRDKSRWVRASAVFALGQIDDPEGVPILIRMLHDKEDMVYRNALTALSWHGDLRALIPILNEASCSRLSASFYVTIIDRFAQAIKE